jgi:long-chain acyl-CoA synthetase
MRNKIFSTFKRLKENNSNFISFYVENKKVIKTFKDFYNDINECYSVLEYLRKESSIQNIAILGETSYSWLVIDWACMMGGFKSLAIPEYLATKTTENLLTENDVHIVLVDKKLTFRPSSIEFLTFEPSNCKFFNKGGYSITGKPLLIDCNYIRRDYSIGFTSGTSGNLKKIIRTFNDEPNQNRSNKFIKRLIHLYYTFPLIFSFWSRRDNKIIIYLPFSHLQQREFALLALERKINIILSDPVNCMKHIVTEKPNIMISVPAIYQLMGERIQSYISKFGPVKRCLFQLFNTWKLNRLSNRNLLKQVISHFLFHNIKKIYGGRANFFITGSAPADPSTIEIFYSIGVKIMEAYGQSESGTISMNTEKNFRIGSVGKPTREIKIDSNSEILIRYEEKWMQDNKELFHINHDGFIHTGDLGYLDEEGYLFLKGRKDEVIVLKNGKKIFSTEIEVKINRHKQVSNSVVFSTDNSCIKAIITIKSGNVVQYSEEDIIEHLRNINSELPVYEQVSAYLILDTNFSVNNGLVTSTLKLKKNEIVNRFSSYNFKMI